MTGRAREAVRQMRRDLHREMEVSALYIAVPNAVPFPCTVRQHDKPEPMAPGAGTPQVGLAQMQATSDRLIFIVDNAPPMIRNNAVVSIAAGEAYRINNTHPIHGITITAEVTRLPPAECVGLPLPVQAVDSSIPPPAGSASYMLAGGYGTIDYQDLDAGTPLQLLANQWIPVTRNLVPSPANFNLPRGPWKNFAFWNGGQLRALAVGDLYLFKFTYTIVSTMRDATLRFAVRPGGNALFDFGPSITTVDADAGEPFSNATTFSEQARSRFVNGGASVYAMLSVDGQLNSFSPEVTPLSYAT